MATQMNAPGPKGYFDTLNMDNKDPVTWEPIADSMSGILTYNTSGETFNYSFAGTGLQDIDYSLIYYADPWPGNGVEHNTGVLIATFTTSGSTIPLTTGSVELNRDLPQWPSDQNHPEGAKIWLVPSTHYSTTTPGAQGYMITWSPSSYLFETALITYDDTDI